MSYFHHWTDLAATEVFPGDSVRAVSGTRLQLIRVEIAPRTHFGLHEHPAEQFIIVIEGRLHFQVGEETSVVTPGSFIHVPPGVKHGGYTEAEGATTLEAFAPPRLDFVHPEAGGLVFDGPR